MKQTRNMYGPVCVTFGLVDEGEIIGTLLSLQNGAAAMEFLEATSPRMATALSCVISFFTAVAAASGWPWSSSGLPVEPTWTLCPSMPPVGVGLGHGKLDAVVGRRAERRLRAGHGAVFADDDGIGTRAAPAPDGGGGMDDLLAQPPTVRARAAAENRQPNRRMGALRMRHGERVLQKLNLRGSLKE